MHLFLQPPPLIIVGLLAGAMLLAKYISPFLSLELPLLFRSFAALVLSVVGGVFATLGVVHFRAHDTTVNPIRPEQASQLVTTGVYQISRNPMYLGFALGLLAWGVFLNNMLSIVFAFAFPLYMNRIQIPREERALENLFGEAFKRYKINVRRWI